MPSSYLERVAGMPALRAIAQGSLDLLKLVSGERVLEVGCGTGVFLTALATAVGPTGQVVGIDHAEPFVERARERVHSLEQVRVEQSDAYRLPFADEAFDAAHCERLLMHLEDPVTALREMRRVVRPGGRVVAAEPDWAGLQIDHQDRTAIRMLIDRWQRATNPSMGLRLNRHMAEAGLVNRTLVPVAIVAREYDELAAYGVDLGETAETLANEGQLQRERGEAIVQELVARSRDGTFCGYLLAFVGRGEVPKARA